MSVVAYDLEMLQLIVIEPSFYPGHKDKYQSGVAIIISREKIKALSEWDPISDRLIRAHFKFK